MEKNILLHILMDEILGRVAEPWTWGKGFLKQHTEMIRRQGLKCSRIYKPVRP